MMTPSKTALASLGLLCGLGFLVTACPAVLDDECAEGACGPRTNAGEGGSDVVDGGADAPVDPCVNTPTDPKCLDENTALFVSAPNGNNADATGSQAKPFKTIGAALGKITATKRRIYVCDGTYPEDLALTAAHSGVSLFGGIDCTFKAVSTNKPIIGATANPVKIDGTTGLAIADVSVVAADAATGSSIAIFASGSDLSLSRVRVTAGAGGNSDPGTRTDYTLNSTLTGNDGSAGGGAKTVVCPAGDTTTGGKGGASGFDGDPGTPGADNKGTVSACSMSNMGGANGAVGTTPAAAIGAVVSGNLKNTGWLPEPGSDGASGGAGQGGGGGAGLGGGTGGGGGAGGCGGKGGGGGNGGGASVAIASYQTTLRLINAVLVAKDAGGGGAGASGQAGQTPGGAGGAKTSATTSCQGGNGAAGGSGAPGGGGAGGISVGILFKGSAPIADDGTKQAIIVGKKGAPGAAVGQMTGADGVAQALLELK